MQENTARATTVLQSLILKKSKLILIIPMLCAILFCVSCKSINVDAESFAKITGEYQAVSKYNEETDFLRGFLVASFNIKR